MLTQLKNTFGAASSSGKHNDLQRSDLFVVNLKTPDLDGLRNMWETEVRIFLEKFPFPSRDRESIPVKYLQQTNLIPGGDAASSTIMIPVRQAFARETAKVLERWHQLIANPRTGGVALPSEVKTDGTFQWLEPTPAAQGASGLQPGLTYVLEGCWPKALKPSDADMSVGNSLVTLEFTLQIDRYYLEEKVI